MLSFAKHLIPSRQSEITSSAHPLNLSTIDTIRTHCQDTFHLPARSLRLYLISVMPPQQQKYAHTLGCGFAKKWDAVSQGKLARTITPEAILPLFGIIKIINGY